MNRPSQILGAEALRDKEYFENTVQKIINTRERVKKELMGLGFYFPDSKANFVFASHESVPAAELFEVCKKENIFVRYFKKPRIDNYLRISIGTDEEMDELIRVIKKYLNKNMVIR